MDATPTHQTSFEPGKVFIVGGGPGDPKLLTAAALELIRKADTLIVDRLIGLERIKNLARFDAEIILASDDRSQRLEELFALMKKFVRNGKTVVRLKSGDPMIFGCGKEEMDWLRSEKIDFECIPGVSAFTAGAAAGEFSLTLRGVSDSLYCMTGHDLSRMSTRWPTLVTLLSQGTTLCVYMGVGKVKEISSLLIEHGCPSDMQACLVHRASDENERVYRASLSEIVQGIWKQVESPGMLYIGDALEKQGCDD